MLDVCLQDAIEAEVTKMSRSIRRHEREREMAMWGTRAPPKTHAQTYAHISPHPPAYDATRHGRTSYAEADAVEQDPREVAKQKKAQQEVCDGCNRHTVCMCRCDDDIRHPPTSCLVRLMPRLVLNVLPHARKQLQR